MILIIDTTEDKSQIFLFKTAKKYKHRIFQAHWHYSENLLKEIDCLLASQREKVQNVKRIVVVNGPGSFTGCRVGVATANALAFSLGVPIIQISKDKITNKNFLTTETMMEILEKTKDKNAEKGNIAQPFYKSEPHITKPKNKA